ncbi:MAG TPA: hypothetical protein VEA99_01310, partial [Gemmatimonadaceae bacterium]|nr:hypothetical protein [Gemmatimonadaceae bacterium]
RLIGKIKNRRFTRAWQPLLPTLQGAEILPDRGGGAASSWLTGTYRGRPVFAQMTPDVGHGGTSDTAGYENRWDTGLRDLTGGHDWSVQWSTAILGIGTTGWSFRSDDPALAARLERSAVRALADSLGRGRIAYSARARTLVLHQDIRPLWVPPPDRFRHELDVLLRMADEVAPLNPP